MKIKAFFIFLIIFILGVFVAFSINGNLLQLSNDSDKNEVEVTYPHAQELTFSPSSKYVKYIGRTVYFNNVCWASMSGSGIEFECEGQYAQFVAYCENAESLTSNHKPRIAVYANDELIVDSVLAEKEQLFQVDLSPYDEKAIIKVIKLSESMYSAFGIGNIKTFGKKDIKPTDNKKIAIEFIGDSLTAGYGIDEERSHAEFSTSTENFSKSYAYLLADELDADYSAVAFSGYGVLSGYTKSGSLNSEDTLINYYDKAITNINLEGGFPDGWQNTRNYDFVIINLGTNDASYCYTAERRIEFTSKYKELLSAVRHFNPEAFILCVLADVNNSMFPYVKKAAEEFSSENNDIKIASALIEFDMGVNGSVIDGHPSEQSHINAAQKLSQIIKFILEPEAYELETTLPNSFDTYFGVNEDEQTTNEENGEAVTADNNETVSETEEASKDEGFSDAITSASFESSPTTEDITESSDESETSQTTEE
ncbi:MAG: SGNH/GDSL hydrolase family protein [Clostridia bacterium]|nr:SGNH/GDSL hydrolase family protein [Clostridia bacterium]